MKLEDVLDYIQPGPYIVESTDYSDDYNTPVLTAGKSFILGKTNEEKGIFNELPVIIFDDFTTATKFVDFRFKVKSSAMKILKPKDSSVNLRFVYYYMQTVRVNFDTHKRYWISEFSQLPINVPPPAEQLRIVQKIEELFSELDHAIATLKTTQQQLQTYRQSVLKYAFEGFFSGSNGWIETDILQVAKKIQIGPFGSQLHQHDYVSNEIPLINPTHIKNGKIVADNDFTITGEKKDSLPNYILTEGDVIMGRRGEMGRCAMVTKKEDGWFCGTGSLYIRPDKKQVNSSYLFYYLSSRKIKEHLEKVGAGTTMTNLNLKIIKSIPFLKPPIKVQESIINEIETRLSESDYLLQTINQQLIHAESLRQSILQRAFSGEL